MAADRDVHSETYRESPPPQLGTGALSERSEGAYTPSQDTAPGFDPLITSHHPKSEGALLQSALGTCAERPSHCSISELMIHDHVSGGTGGDNEANNAGSAKKQDLKRIHTQSE